MAPATPLLASDSKTSCTLPYAIVTGANKPSLGFRTAQILASTKFGRHTVVLACRNEHKGLAAKAVIEKQDPGAKCVYLQLDLGCLASVASFVQSFIALDGGAPLKKGVGLAILINNAGVGFPTPRELTTDGLEKVFATNHLGVMYLTNLLVPALQAAPHARVVMVASSLHDPAVKMGPVEPTLVPGGDDREDLDLELAKPGVYEGALAYRNSKLMNVMFGYAMQRRLRKAGCDSIAVNVMCPGFIPTTGLSRNASCFAQFFLRYCLDGVLKCCCNITRTVEEGAMCEVLCAVSHEAESGGHYFEYTRKSEFRAKDSSLESYKEELQDKLWQASVDLIVSKIGDGARDVFLPK